MWLRHLAFRVTNIEEVVKEFRRKGYLLPTYSQGHFTGEKMTFFADPDGLPFGVARVVFDLNF